MSAEFLQLYQAIVSDNQIVYTELRNSNTDVDILLKETVKHSDDTLLHVAANWNRRYIAEIIVELQPSLLSATNSKGQTPLHVAASAGSEDVTRVIINLCHQIEVVETGEAILRKKSEKEEDTALHKAVRNGHLGVVKLLIDEDPELTKLVIKDGDSPLFMAVDTRRFQIARRILTVSDCSFKGRKNMNALHAAIAHRYSRHHAARGIVTSLIQNREAGLLEQQDEGFGWTPLHYAAHMNDTQTIKLLLSAEHSLACIKDSNGMTLHIAAKQGHVVIAVEKLVKICPEICGIVDDKGQSFFHIAVKSGKIRVDPRLSRATTNSDGLTVLDIPIQSLGSLLVIRGLVATLTAGGTPGINHLLGRQEIKKSEEEVDKSWDLREINLLVSTIIATVSFTAALSVPGSFKSDGPDEGTAALAQKSDYRGFVICNTIAFTLSVSAVIVSRYIPSLKSIFDNLTLVISQLATVAMVAAFVYGTSTVLGPSEAKLGSYVTYTIRACFSLTLFALGFVLVTVLI